MYDEAVMVLVQILLASLLVGMALAFFRLVRERARDKNRDWEQR